MKAGLSDRIILLLVEPRKADLRRPRVHVSFCAEGTAGENVNGRNRGIWVKLREVALKGKDETRDGRTIMEDQRRLLEEKLSRLLSEAAQVEVELSRAEGAIVGVPHYSVIESRAHELGRQLSRQVQQRQMAESAARAAPQARCPTCGTLCELKAKQRQITSIDGPLPIQELQGRCPSCRRDFFPSAGDVGTGRS